MKVFVYTNQTKGGVVNQIQQMYYCIVALWAVHGLRPMFTNGCREPVGVVVLNDFDGEIEMETAFLMDTAADGKPLFIMNIYMPLVRQAAAMRRTTTGAYLRELIADRLESIVEPVEA